MRNAKRKSPQGDSGSLTTCGAAVVKWLDYSLPTSSNRVLRFPAGSLPDYCARESWRTIPLIGGFSRGSPVSPVVIPPLAAGATSAFKASHQGEPGSIPSQVTRFSQVGIVPDDAVGRRIFSGISVSPAPSFRRFFIYTSITLIGSQDLAVQSHPNLFTHSTFDRAAQDCVLRDRYAIS
ncbi:hypothetical protein PR048_030317 [Dryococelus australis]|uniref:Uncharacterized protein n=1 Tax=Dryococelus australis TaxID=614101 RepID=A0ABQ9G8P3_9NEOP|nr:hypothetical protein PR048_030317 [Dryococelus australis]